MTRDRDGSPTHTTAALLHLRLRLAFPLVATRPPCPPPLPFPEPSHFHPLRPWQAATSYHRWQTQYRAPPASWLPAPILLTMPSFAVSPYAMHVCWPSFRSTGGSPPHLPHQCHAHYPWYPLLHNRIGATRPPTHLRLCHSCTLAGRTTNGSLPHLTPACGAVDAFASRLTEAAPGAESASGPLCRCSSMGR